VSPRQTAPDPELSAALAAADGAFAQVVRPDKFTDHPYCDECADPDEYFRNFTRSPLQT
jgi:hypothetical protein